jgi:surface protein
MVAYFPALELAANPAYNPASDPFIGAVIDGGDPFVMDIDTTKLGTSTNTEFQLPIYNTGNYDFSIDWGDGNVEQVTSDAILVHNYAVAGVYEIKITGTIEGFATFGNGDPSKILNIKQWGPLKFGNFGSWFKDCINLQITAPDIPDLTGITSFLSIFSGCENLILIPNIEQWDVSNVTVFQGAFIGCLLFNQDLSNWDVSSGINFGSMFQACEVFNQPLDNWDMSNAQFLFSMFRNAVNFNQNLNSWNTANAFNMSGIFDGASNFNGNISSWNTGNNTSFSYMFRFCNNFNQDLSNWDVSKGTTFVETFSSCFAFNADISGWNTASATNFSSMFTNASIFDQNLGGWDVTQLTVASKMFQGIALSLNNYNNLLIGWNNQTVKQSVIFSAGNSKYSAGAPADARANLINNDLWVITDAGQETAFISEWITNFAGVSNNDQIALPLDASGTYNFNVFYNGNNIKTVTSHTDNIITFPDGQGTKEIQIFGTLSGWGFKNAGDKSKLLKITNFGDLDIADVTGAFYGCNNLTFDTFDPLDLTNVTTLKDFIRGAFSVYEIPFIETWNLITVTSLEGAFREASGFDANIGNWDVSNVTNLNETFFLVGSLNQDLSSWNVSNVTTMVRTFRSLNPFWSLLDLTTWDVSNVQDFTGCFFAAQATPDISNWNTSGALSMREMFQSSQFNGDLSLWDVSNVTDFFQMFGSCNYNQPIGVWNVGSATIMNGMFSFSNFNQDITGWNTSNCISFREMFRGNGAFQQLIGNWNVSSGQDFNSMFRNCNFNQPLNNWNMISAQNLSNMFQVSLFNQPINNWNVSNVTNISNMFIQNSQFDQPLDLWDVSSVTDFRNVFAITTFNQDISGWNVASGTNFSGMFINNTIFNQDLSAWNVANATNLSAMFSNVINVDFDAGGWDVSNVQFANGMFTNVLLSTTNYDNLLIGWSALTLQPNVQFSAGFSKYSAGAAATARANILSTYNWTIFDGGQV